MRRDQSLSADALAALTKLEHEIARVAPSASLFLLADAGPASRIASQLNSYPQRTLFENDSASGDAPRVIELPAELRQELKAQLLESDIRAPWLHWIWSAHPLEDVCTHLKQLLEGVAEIDNSEMLVRYFDRTVWPFYFGALNDEQRQALLNPLAAWASLQSDGQWDVHLNKKDGPVPDGAFQFNDAQIVRIALSTLPMALYNALEDEFPAQLNDANYPQSISALSEIVNRAANYKIETYQAYYHFATLALGIHPQFDQHPQVADRIKTVQEGKQQFASAMQQVPAAVWDQLAEAHAASTSAMNANS